MLASTINDSWGELYGGSIDTNCSRQEENSYSICRILSAVFPFSVTPAAVPHQIRKNRRQKDIFFVSKVKKGYHNSIPNTILTFFFRPKNTGNEWFELSG